MEKDLVDTLIASFRQHPEMPTPDFDGFAEKLLAHKIVPANYQTIKFGYRPVSENMQIIPVESGTQVNIYGDIKYQHEVCMRALVPTEKLKEVYKRSIWDAAAVFLSSVNVLTYSTDATVSDLHVKANSSLKDVVNKVVDPYILLARYSIHTFSSAGKHLDSAYRPILVVPGLEARDANGNYTHDMTRVLEWERMNVQPPKVRNDPSKNPFVFLWKH
jgi:hypothetical protein